MQGLPIPWADRAGAVLKAAPLFYAIHLIIIICRDHPLGNSLGTGIAKRSALEVPPLADLFLGSVTLTRILPLVALLTVLYPAAAWAADAPVEISQPPALDSR